MSGNNLFSDYPFTQSDSLGLPGGYGGPGSVGWEIESFNIADSTFGTDNNNELWHAPALDQPGLAFCWAFPRIGFSTLQNFSSFEQSIGTPGRVTIYGIDSSWTNDIILADFQKGLTGTGQMQSWKRDLGIDVSIYGGIGIIMDPAWYEPNTDGTHVVRQTNVGRPFGIQPQNMACMTSKTLGVQISHIVTELPGVLDPRHLMTHWMKVGVA